MNESSTKDEKDNNEERGDIYERLNAFRPPVCPRGAKKHPCPDCSCCQFCSDARCELCRGIKTSEGPNETQEK